MKYQNANRILPKELLEEVQKYAAGQLLYIPKPEYLHQKWGEESESRKYLLERNRNIRELFSQGTYIHVLADLFCLSADSIRKIVYSKPKNTGD